MAAMTGTARSELFDLTDDKREMVDEVRGGQKGNTLTRWEESTPSVLTCPTKLLLLLLHPLCAAPFLPCCVLHVKFGAATDVCYSLEDYGIYCKYKSKVYLVLLIYVRRALVYQAWCVGNCCPTALRLTIPGTR